MNRFLREKRGREEEDDPHYVAFVDSIHEDYDKGWLENVYEASSADSPFIGKTPEECAALLKELHANTNLHMNLDGFAMMDERSMNDDTMLIVSAKEGCASVRAEFAVVVTALIDWMEGEPVKKDIEAARKRKDNVIRWMPELDD